MYGHLRGVIRDVRQLHPRPTVVGVVTAGRLLAGVRGRRQVFNTRNVLGGDLTGVPRAELLHHLVRETNLCVKLVGMFVILFRFQQWVDFT